MTLRDIALLIPSSSRKWILETNAIYKAIANSEDPHMKGLFTIWYTFVETNEQGDMSCGICVTRTLAHYTEIQDALIQLAKEEKLLEL